MFTFLVCVALLILLAAVGQGLIAVILAIFMMPMLISKWSKYATKMDEKFDEFFESRKED